MPYILVRGVMQPNSSFRGTTIEGQISANTRRQLHIEGSRGGADETTLSPCDVLNILETEGYKVVGTNTVTQFPYNDLTYTTHYMIWTLHKQA